MTFPPPPFTHLRRLTDGGGLYEHAKGTTPRREHGYCLDDVARALVVVSRETDPGQADLREQYLDFVLAAGTNQLIRQNRAIMARPDARLHLPRVTCPTLVVCGDSDQLTPPECSREIASLIPKAQLHFVAQCGHMLTMERPEEVNALLLDWLNRL